MKKLLEIIFKFFNSQLYFLLLILLSLSLLLYSEQYVSQIRNSFLIPYCRIFSLPEHGRYIASFLYNLFIILLYKLHKTINSQKSQEVIYIPNLSSDYHRFDITVSDIVSNLLCISENDFKNLKVLVFSNSKNFSKLNDKEVNELRFTNLIVPEKSQLCLKNLKFDTKYE